MINGFRSNVTIYSKEVIRGRLYIGTLSLCRPPGQAQGKWQAFNASKPSARISACKPSRFWRRRGRRFEERQYSTITSRRAHFKDEVVRNLFHSEKPENREGIDSKEIEDHGARRVASSTDLSEPRSEPEETDMRTRQQASNTWRGELEGWELTVGIEIHAELPTTCKLFSAAATSLFDSPNTHVSVFDAGFPGAQPTFQKESLVPALRAALALGCEVQTRSSFDRKHYFHWDQPNGYQITQYYEPLAKNGRVILYEQDGIDPADLPSVIVGVKQVQLEQDTAKTTLQPPNVHLLDFNRASHPLIEIISLPQIHTPKTAAAYVRKVQSILKTVGANTTGMEMGGLRADVNVSVSRTSREDQGLSAVQGQTYAGISGLGQRTEIKNISSFKAVEDAITAEMTRQVRLLESGLPVIGETRGWTIGETETRRLRGKEGEVDYRYMPDPDLQPILIAESLIRYLKDTLPMLPDETHQQLTKDPRYQISPKDAKTLATLEGGERLDYFFEVVDAVIERLMNDGYPASVSKVGKTTANWILHELPHLPDTSNEPQFIIQADPSTQPSTVWPPIDPATLADILAALLKEEITLPAAKDLLRQFSIGGQHSTDSRPSVAEVIVTEGLRLQLVGEEQYLALAQGLIKDNPKMADEAQKAEAKLQGKPTDNKSARKNGKLMWFVGQMVQKGDKSKIQPAVAEKVVRNLLFKSK